MIMAPRERVGKKSPCSIVILLISPMYIPMSVWQTHYFRERSQLLLCSAQQCRDGKISACRLHPLFNGGTRRQRKLYGKLPRMGIYFHVGLRFLWKGLSAGIHSYILFQYFLQKWQISPYLQKNPKAAPLLPPLGLIQAIHAGVECGFFCGKMPGLDCVSFGPDMKDIHSLQFTADGSLRLLRK